MAGPVIRKDTLSTAIGPGDGKDSALLVDSEGKLWVNTGVAEFTGDVTITGTPNVAVTSHTTQNVTLYTSSARTATPTAVTFTNEYHKGVLIVVSVTTGSATPSVTPSLQFADPVTGSYLTIWTAAAAITSTSAASYKYLMYPGIGTTEEAGITENIPLPLPRGMQLTMTHGDADSLTYSVGAILLV